MPFYAHTPSKNSEKWHLLEYHLSKVAKLAEIFGNKFHAGKLTYYAGLWHDLGKYNPEFQQYLEQCDRASKSGEKAPRQKVLHAKYGAKLAAEKFPFLTSIIYGHHAGLPQGADMMARIAEIDCDTHQHILKNAIKESLNTDIDSETERQYKNLLSDVYSNELLIRLLFSCLVDADYLYTETHFAPEQATIRTENKRRDDLKIDCLWQSLERSQEELLGSAENSQVNLVQSQVYNACLDAAKLKPGVFRLAVFTGGGKTLSGLAFTLSHAVEHNLE